MRALSCVLGVAHTGLELCECTALTRTPALLAALRQPKKPDMSVLCSCTAAISGCPAKSAS